MLLVSSVEAYTEKMFNCYSCLHQYDHHPNKDRMLADRQRLQACKEPRPNPKFQIEQVKYFKCPGNFYEPSMAYLMEGYEKYKQGVMPYPGSFYDQPAKIIEIYKLIDALLVDKRRKAQDEANRKAKRSRRR